MLHLDRELYNPSDGRNAPPSHYLFKVEWFSRLSQAQVKKYISDAFDARGYKWKLNLYPNGDNGNNGEDPTRYDMYNPQVHISVYLELEDTSSLPAGWEINVMFNIFIFNQLQDKYETVQEERVIRLFHAMKTMWGISKFMELERFRNPRNGYLINDTCVFGAEVFVVKNTFKGECLSMLKESVIDHHSWKVNNFSTLLDESYGSEVFGGYKWNILLYPIGDEEAKGNHISIFLSYDQSCIPSKTKLFVKLILSVRDQKNGNHIECEDDKVFCSSTVPGCGFPKFMSLVKLKDPQQGYLVEDSCIIESEVKLLGLITES